MIPHTAMIFAAGFGKRMLPLTAKTPKPLIAVAGKTLLDYRLDALAASGVKRAVINVHHLGEQIIEHVKTRTDIEIIISAEDEILETGGGLVKALPLLGKDPIYLLNSDIIWYDYPHETPALERLANYWDPESMDMLMLLHPTQKAFGYEGKGDFSITENGTIEKTENQHYLPYIYSGVQVFKPQLLQNEPLRCFSLSHIFKQHLLQNQQGHARFYGLVHSGEWYHVGTVESIKQTEMLLSKNTL